MRSYCQSADRRRRTYPWLAVVTALLAALVLASVALAESPFRVSSQLEDQAGVLGGQRDEAQAAIDDLQQSEKVQLWMVYVDTFSGTPATEWADETAQKSDLGLNDVLIAVAVEDRAYAYSVAQDFPLTDGQLNDIMANDVEPFLSQSDWAGAAIGAAQGMQQALGGEPAAPSGGGSTGSGSTWVIIAVVVIAVLAIGGFFVARSLGRAPKARGGQLGGAKGAEAQTVVPLDELRKQANSQLVETDDAIKTSEEEVGFAVAEFGEEAAAPFQAALDVARTELAAAFKLRTELDDEQDEATQRQLLTGILQHTGAANDRLDAESDRFDRLRDLENNVPQLLSSLEDRLAGLEARLPQADQTLAELAGVYAQAAISPVAANPADARTRIAFARDEIGDSREDSDAGRRGEAVVTAVAAEEAAGQAQQLLDAVERLRDDLAAAAGRIEEDIAETQRDIAEAQTIGDQAQFAALIATARAAVDAAAAAAAPKGGRDPLAALLRLRQADDALERALQPVRDEMTRRAKAAASYERTVLAARSELASAADYITTHRGAVGSGSRTRLAEAQQNLDQALAVAAADPVAAAQYAARAQELAGSALAQAQADVASAEAGGFPQPMRSGGSGGGMGNVAGAIIGGILINAMLGGGGRGGFGGSGGGRRGGFGGFSPPSFGGGGTRMRRGGGGRF